MIQRIDGVLCLGNICYDIPVWAVDDVHWGKSIWVDEISCGLGGNGANTSYTLAKMGTAARLYGAVGRDMQGEALVAALESAGVQLDLERTSNPTTSTVVLVQSSSDRTFLHRPGASRDATPAMVKFDVPGFSHFHLANPFSLPNVRGVAGELMAAAQRAGLTTSLDTAWDAKGRWLQDIGPALPYTDLLFVNETEAEMLTGSADPAEAVRVLRGHGATDVVIKLGAEGAVAFEGANEPARLAGFAVVAKDTTGAGDCFAGAFLAALHRGLSYADALRIANAAGAMSVEQLGAVSGIRPWDETESWIASHGTL